MITLDSDSCQVFNDEATACGSPATQRVSWHEGFGADLAAGQYTSWRTAESSVDRCGPHAAEFEVDALADETRNYMAVHRTNI